MENIEMALPLGGTLMMDEDAASIIAQIRNLLGQLRIKGITDKEIDTILTQQQKPGRAYINSRGMLVLPDENGVQIKLTPMERTLYILFLRYPEGINADELWRYWDELCKIYGSQMIYGDRSLIEDAVEGICDEEKVTWYTNVSRIKRKITDKLGKRAAEQYIIRRWALQNLCPADVRKVNIPMQENLTCVPVWHIQAITLSPRLMKCTITSLSLLLTFNTQEIIL